jgi:hypothetical protein
LVEPFALWVASLLAVIIGSSFAGWSNLLALNIKKEPLA